MVKQKENNNMDDREKALALVNAYFDGKDIFMRDPDAGVPNWVSVNHPEYWSYLTMFCKNTDKYQVIEKPKKQLECKVGDCFVEFCDLRIQLYRITADLGNDIEFDVIDIYVNSADISQYDDDLSKEIAFEHFTPIDSEIFSKVEKICDELDTQVNYMYKGAVVMIKELCQEVNQNQEKE